MVAVEPVGANYGGNSRQHMAPKQQNLSTQLDSFVTAKKTTTYLEHQVGAPVIVDTVKV